MTTPDKNVKNTVKKDAKEIVRRLKERTPEFETEVKRGLFPLDFLAELFISQYLSFNNQRDREVIVTTERQAAGQYMPPTHSHR